MARVFDCFVLFNELDLLDLRLHELCDVVDRFVIAEATTTFAGEPKALHFRAHQSRFADFADRITYIVVDDMPGQGASGWDRQSHQRQALARGLVGATDDDIILLSDVDEIVRPEALRQFIARDPGKAEIGCFELRHFNYYLNWECDQRWLRSGPRAVRHRFFRDFPNLRWVRGPSETLFQDLGRGIDCWRRFGRPMHRVLFKDAGWHFTYLGGAEALVAKDRSFRGSEKPLFDADASAHDIAARWIKEGRAIKIDGDAHVHWRPIDESFPRHLQSHLAQFAHLIADPPARDREISA